MSEERLRQLVTQGDPDGVVTFFKGMPENERKKYEKTARSLFTEVEKIAFAYFQKVEDTPAFARLHEHNTESSCRVVSAFTAVVASCPISSVRKACANFHLDDHIEYISTEEDSAPTRALADRKPQWAQEFAEWLAKSTFANWWMFIWRIVRAGICERPESMEYYRLFHRGAWSYSRRIHGLSVADFIQRNLEYVQAEVWSIFTVDAVVQGDEWFKSEEQCFGVLPRLAEQGRISRQRLIQETQHALNRDFREGQLRWYVSFHEKLSPSSEECASFVEDYLALLNNKTPAAVRLAINALKRVMEAGKLDAKKLLSALSPALVSETKGVAIDALALLKALGTKQHALQPRIAALAATALSHSATEVNERAFALIKTFATPELDEVVNAIHSNLENAASSVRSSVQEWLGAAAIAGEEPQVGQMDELLARANAVPVKYLNLAGIAFNAGKMGIDRLAFRRSQVPCLDPVTSIVPIRELEELVETASRQLVAPADVDQVERIYDGIARIGTQRPEHFGKLTGELRKLTEEQHWRWAAPSAAALRLLVHAWIVKGLIPREINASSIRARFLQERTGWIMQRVSHGTSQGLLSLPTHSGGWVDPRILSKRVIELQATGGVSDRIDWVLALLRLAPDGRHDALSSAANALGEEGSALRYALGGQLEEVTRSPWLWAAASRARDPDATDADISRKFPHLAAEEVRPAAFQSEIEERSIHYGTKSIVLDAGAVDAVPANEDAAHITSCFRASGRAGRLPYALSEFTALDIRTIASMWPLRREPFCAMAASELGDNIDWLQARWDDKTWLEPLLEPDCEMGEMPTALLATALAFKEPGMAGLATDILIAGISDGRIDGEQLGARMGGMLFTGLVKPSRWAKTLSEAARVSALHAQEIRKAIERALADGKGEPPVGLHWLVELLFELAFQAGTVVGSASTRQFLSGIRGSSKLARAANNLVTLTERTTGHSAQAEAIALQGRVERAERWTRWAEGGDCGARS